jgi:hypothetical protein
MNDRVARIDVPYESSRYLRDTEAEIVEGPAWILESRGWRQPKTRNSVFVEATDNPMTIIEVIHSDL